MTVDEASGMVIAKAVVVYALKLPQKCIRTHEVTIFNSSQMPVLELLHLLIINMIVGRRPMKFVVTAPDCRRN